MATSRLLVIKKSPATQKPVVYVMSRDQRVQDNHALLAAQELALQQKTTLYVLFVIKSVKNRSVEHYKFMIEGLKEVSGLLSSYGITFVLRAGNPAQQIQDFASETNAGAIFFDFSPLVGARSLVKEVANNFNGSVTVVDTHNIIPAWIVSNKQEFAAHTMRSKVHKKLAEFLAEPPLLKKQLPAPLVSSIGFDEAESFLSGIPVSGVSIGFTPGEAAARSRLNNFIDHGLESYAQQRNNMANDCQTGLSPYLHFGQISSLRVAIEIIHSVKKEPLLLRESTLANHSSEPSRQNSMDVLLEEMIVRKELSDNFCLYNENYLLLEGAPEWAQKTLREHADDQRDFIYNLSEWESAKTHDKAWNAAQTELIKTGKMHGYMRMYWAKKILEWSISPSDAIKTAVYLNDKYSIDGGDPNGYAGILWSIAGLHDRPWFERPVFGKVRYMNEAGLRRKFAIDEYIQRVSL